MTLNKTLSIRVNALKLADLKRQAAEETIRRGDTVNVQDLIREVMEEKFFNTGAANEQR